MADSFANIVRKIESATKLLSVVRSMKVLAAANINQYEKSNLALKSYYESVELGLVACLHKDFLKPYVSLQFPKHENKIICAIVFGSDQGLVGQFNSQIADFTKNYLNKLKGEKKIWAIGDRVASYLLDSGFKLMGVIPVPNSVKFITPLIVNILSECLAITDKHSETELHLFNHYHTGSSIYEPVKQQLLPIDKVFIPNLSQKLWPTVNIPQIVGKQETFRAFIREYLFVSIFRACSESLASENASRLAAMQRADKNISTLIEDLQKLSHRLRQEQIDEELFDVISGYEALQTN